MANSTKVIIKNVRFSYVKVFHPDQESGKYGCAILIKKGDPQMDEIKAAIKAAAEEGRAKLGDRFTLKLADIIHDGDEKAAEQPDYAGMWYLNAKSGTKPGIVKKNTSGMGGATVEITDEAEFYSGCYGAVSVTFYAYNAANGSKKGVTCGLNNCLKVKDGPSMGGRVSAESEFKDLDLGDFGGSNDDEDIY